jgi:CHAT domain-containing protein
MAKGFGNAKPDKQSYTGLIKEILRVVEDSKSNKKKVYSLLEKNLHLLDEQFVTVFKRWAKMELSQLTTGEASNIAANIGNFCTLLQEFPLGEKANNLEISITGYEISLTIFTRSHSPENWAIFQINLGVAYSNRIRGDKAENLEDAIRYYNAALEEYKRDRFPEDWANVQMKLGDAHSYRIRGDKAENLEDAIRHHKAALEVFKRDRFPEDWANVQMSLGVGYWYRIRGDKAKNLEDAISYYNAALDEFKRDRFPEDWARTQCNLGNAYLYRVWGDKAENLENAIGYYDAALDECKRDRFPEDWGNTNNSLGLAYVDRIQGQRSENLNTAISCYRETLKVWERKSYPEYWAVTHNNLGNAYREYIRENKTENWQDAIQPLQASLEIFTPNSFPHRHVEAEYNLGFTYQCAQQLENAYQTYKSSIDTVELLRGEIFSGAEAKQKLAEEWNKLYQGMAEVCLQLGQDGEAIEYIERSKTRNLVELLANQSQALQQVGLEIEEEKRRLAAAKEMQVQGGEENTEVTRLNQLREERNQKIDKIIPLQPMGFAEIQALLTDNRTAILEWYIFAECFRAFVITQDGEKPLKWQSSREDLEKLNKFSEGFLHIYNKEKSKWRHDLASRLQELANILHIDEILKLIPDNCETLILVPHRFLHLYPLHALPIANRNDLTPQPPSLQGKGENEERTLLGGNGENELIPIQQQVLLDRFAGGVKYAPSSQLLKFVKKSRERQNINTESQSFFAVQDPNDNLLYANIEVETIKCHFQPTPAVLEKSAATRDALLQKPHSESLQTAQVLHFSCHAYFNIDSPAESAIALAGCGVSGENNSGNTPENSSYRDLPNGDQIDLKKCLTLGDIFNLSLPKCRLVTLSACETGRTDVNSSDEYIGLPSGFIKAGSSSVISSLWLVDDFFTTLLMIRFYDIFYGDSANQSPSLSTAKALSQAQYWSRTSTQAELIAWTKNHPKIDAEHKLTIVQVLETRYKPDQIPLKNLEAWAGFCAIGD